MLSLSLSSFAIAQDGESVDLNDQPTETESVSTDMMNQAQDHMDSANQEVAKEQLQKKAEVKTAKMKAKKEVKTAKMKAKKDMKVAKKQAKKTVKTAKMKTKKEAHKAKKEMKQKL